VDGGIAGQISLKETIAASGWGSSGQHIEAGYGGQWHARTLSREL
jgi:hypothetical protein